MQQLLFNCELSKWSKIKTSPGFSYSSLLCSIKSIPHFKNFVWVFVAVCLAKTSVLELFFVKPNISSSLDKSGYWFCGGGFYF